MSKKYCIVATYPAHKYPTFDERLEQAVGACSDSSGIGFGVRDLCWSRKTKKSAERIYKILTRFRSAIVMMEEEE